MSNPITSTATDDADEYTCFAEAETVTVTKIRPKKWKEDTGGRGGQGVKSSYLISASISGETVEKYVQSFGSRKTPSVMTYLYPNHLTTASNAPSNDITEYSRLPARSGRWANVDPDPEMFRPSKVNAGVKGLGSELTESGVGDMGSKVAGSGVGDVRRFRTESGVRDVGSAADQEGGASEQSSRVTQSSWMEWLDREGCLTHGYGKRP